MGNSENGFSLIAVLVALAILSILAAGMLNATSNTLHVYKITKALGQLEDARNIFRGSVSCATDCESQMKEFPKVIGDWKLRVKCNKDDIPVLEAKSDIDSLKRWRPVFAENAEKSICKQDVKGPVSTDYNNKRVYCPFGKKLIAVNMQKGDIECK